MHLTKTYSYHLLLVRSCLTIMLFLAFGQMNTVNAQYCQSGATSTFDSNCGEVIFNTINNNTAGICATYSDFTNLSTTVNLGNQYSLSVMAGTCGGNFTKHGKVYIDYNQNQSFLDPGEEVFAFGPSPGTQTFTTNITIPVTAVIGSTRMRVVVHETGALGNVAPCGTFTWGETEDYTVQILPSSPNDIGVTSITSPNSGCNLTATEQVTIDVTNFGTNTQTAWTVSYQLGANPVVTEPMAVSLPSGATVSHTFATPVNLATPGNYTLKAWANLVADTVPVNDSTDISITSIPGISVYPYIQDFESGAGGWIAGGTNNTWAFGTPNKPTINSPAPGGVNSWVTGGLGAGQYSANEDSYVIGPCFDFSSLQNPWISMDIWWNAEAGWDGSNLQYSTDFGNTWQNVGAFGDPGNWYNDGSIISTPGGEGEGWSGRGVTGSGSWVTAAHRLNGLAGQQSVRLRVTFGSDGSIHDDGFAFDNINISEGPVAQLPADTLLCGGDTLQVTPGVFAEYFWFNSDTNAVTNITNGGTIWVKVTDSLGFFDFDTMQVAFSNPFTNIGPDSTICPGDSVMLDAGVHNNGTYLWSNGDQTQTTFVSTAGNHSVFITDSVGCTTADTMNITIAIPPSLDLGSDTTVCSNQPVLLDAGFGPVGTTYDWSTGANTQVVVVTSAGQYIASVTTPGGCAAIDTIQVFNNPSPGVNLGPDRVECGSFTLDAGAGGTSYAWAHGPATQSVTETQAGTYQVTVTNQFGCTAVDQVQITMGQVPVVNLGADTVICNGQTIPLNAGNPGATYFWSNGATTQSINVTAPGLYIVEVTNQVGCTGTDTLRVIGSNLLVELGPGVSICGNGSVFLDAGNPGMSYVWSTGSTSQSIFANTPGQYAVTVTDQLGCTAVDDIQVGSLPGINAAIAAPATANLFGNVQFNDATAPAATSWEWDFGDGGTSIQQNPTHAYVALGQFTVRLISSDGTCRDTTEHTIDVNTVIGVEEEFFAQAMELYPNPSDGLYHLYLEFAKPQNLEVAVMDLTGKVLMQESHRAVLTHREDFDLGQFAKGVYILRLEAAGKVHYTKLILQ